MANDRQATPEQIAAAWRAFRGGRGGALLGPGPAFREAIDAALAAQAKDDAADLPLVHVSVVGDGPENPPHWQAVAEVVPLPGSAAMANVHVAGVTEAEARAGLARELRALGRALLAAEV